MLPYMSQGAVMVVEDGAALAVALNLVSSIADVHFALRIFEQERIKGSGDVQNASTLNGTI
jgi:salicylate hydroxylase